MDHTQAKVLEHLILNVLQVKVYCSYHACVHSILIVSLADQYGFYLVVYKIDWLENAAWAM